MTVVGRRQTNPFRGRELKQGALTRLLTTLGFFYTNTKMVNLTDGIDQERAFLSYAPGYWAGNGGIAPVLWKDWKWQLQNRVTKLGQLEEHLSLSEEERAGVLLSGDKLALAITPHFFNLIPRENPDDPIRRQMDPRIEETWSSPYDMADPCGEDSHMPVPGLVHRYPDRVLFLVTDRCAAYCRHSAGEPKRLACRGERRPGDDENARAQTVDVPRPALLPLSVRPD